MLSESFAFALVRLALVTMPIYLWCGYAWGRAMGLLFGPPGRGGGAA